MWEKAAISFGPDQIRTLFFMAIDRSHWVIMGKILWPLKSFHFFYRIFFIIAGNKDIYNIWNEFEIGLDRTKDCGQALRAFMLKLPCEYFIRPEQADGTISIFVCTIVRHLINFFLL